MLNLIMSIFFTIVLTVTGSALFFGFLRTVSLLRRDNAYVRSLPHLDGPPPGHPDHDAYILDVEYDTISPLGADPLHCGACTIAHSAAVYHLIREIDQVCTEHERKLQRDRWRAEALEREARCPHEGAFNQINFLIEVRPFWKCQDCGKRMADDFDPWNWSAS